jgi:hypothetical protein
VRQSDDAGNGMTGRACVLVYRASAAASVTCRRRHSVVAADMLILLLLHVRRAVGAREFRRRMEGQHLEECNHRPELASLKRNSQAGMPVILMPFLTTQ